MRVLGIATTLLLGSAMVGRCETHFMRNRAGAIMGWDPVTYLDGGGPRPGSLMLRHRYAGATWHFATKANREKFKATPKKYLPRYGGWCADAIADGYVRHSDPSVWRMLEGQLYFFEDEAARRRWSRAPGPRVETAEQRWPTIREHLRDPERESIERRQPRARTEKVSGGQRGTISIQVP